MKTKSYLGIRGSEEYKKNMSKLITQKIKAGCNHYFFPKNQWLGKNHTNESKMKISNSLKKQFANGRKPTKYWINKKRLNLIGKTRLEITINKIKEARAKQITPLKDTSIEIKIQSFLKQLSINFFTHQYIKDIEHSYQCDILIPSMNLVIECDGDYWHNYPIGKYIDHIRTKELLDKGFKVLRLWEHEIKVMDINKFKDKIWNIK